MTRAPTYPIHRNRRNSISIRFSVRSIRFSRCGLRACRPSPSRLARARRQGDTLPPSRARVKGKAALHRDSTTRRAGRGKGRREPARRRPTGDGKRRERPGTHEMPRRRADRGAARRTANEALECEKRKLGPHGDHSRDSALAWSGESEACTLSIQANQLARFGLGARLNPNDSFTK